MMQVSEAMLDVLRRMAEPLPCKTEGHVWALEYRTRPSKQAWLHHHPVVAYGPDGVRVPFNTARALIVRRLVIAVDRVTDYPTGDRSQRFKLSKRGEAALNGETGIGLLRICPECGGLSIEGREFLHDCISLRGVHKWP